MTCHGYTLESLQYPFILVLFLFRFPLSHMSISPHSRPQSSQFCMLDIKLLDRPLTGEQTHEWLNVTNTKHKIQT